MASDCLHAHRNVIILHIQGPKRVPKYLGTASLWRLSWFATNAPALLVPGRQWLWLRCVLLNGLVKTRQLGITGTRDDNIVLWLATSAI